MKKQFLTFASAGVVNTATSYLIYSLLVIIEINYLIAATVSYLAGTVVSYKLNAKHTFKTSSNRKGYARFLVINLFLYGFGIVVLYYLVEYRNIGPLISQLFVVFLRLPINFILSKRYVFSEKK